MSASRRTFLASSAALLSWPAVTVAEFAAAESTAPDAPVRYCLNTSTIRGQKLSVPEQIAIAAEAGYDGIEPWIRDLRAYTENGGSLAEVKARLEDAGLQVESAIGFAQWAVNDAAARSRGLDEFRRDMDMIRQIGGTRIAAPPVGMHGGDAPTLDLDAAAERYHFALELGRETGVVPQLEFWGPSKNLFALPQALYVAAAAGHPDACLLPDIYHMFRGGSSFESISLLAGTAVHCFHLNDYPAGKARTEYNDADRVFPGDGVAPITHVLRTLLASGFRGALSLELFNREYWQRDPAEIARQGLDAMRQQVQQANMEK